MMRLLAGCLACALLSAQIIPFESNGLLYKTLTKGGVTVMFAYLPAHLKEYSIMQVSISNGSLVFLDRQARGIQLPPAGWNRVASLNRAECREHHARQGRPSRCGQAGHHL